MLRRIAIATALAAVFAAPAASGQEVEDEVGIEERLGEHLPLDGLTFYDEEGEAIEFRSLLDKPVALTLVYLRCPGICTPLLREVARVVDETEDLNPPEGFRLVSVSFDPTETYELAGPKRVNMLAEIDSKDVPLEGWRFLTGEAEPIQDLTEAVGFKYARDKNGIDYIHAGVVIFISKEGKIVRYLNGPNLSGADFQMAVIDAMNNKERSMIQRLQKLCFSYDPESQQYIVQTNRIILAVTGVIVAAFAVFLLVTGAKGGKGERRRATGRTVSQE